jgi:hypothetical protein
VEGSVKEFPLWNGRRVTILGLSLFFILSVILILFLRQGKAPFAKKFEPIRVFDKLQAKITIKQTLNEQEVTAMLQEIGKTDDSVRSAAIEYYKQWKPVAK